jgi:hypothetical protein
MSRHDVKGLTLSKRAKGFALSLHYSHYFIIQQLYPWLQQIGALDEDMAEAYDQLPKFDVTAEDVQGAQQGEQPSFMSYDEGFYKSKTTRVRSEHVKGMAKLLKTVAMFCHQGQAGGTLWRRGEALDKVSALDLLADAGE